jgi:hypothetical protein
MRRIGILEHRRRPEQQPVNDAEHRGIGADAEAKGHHNGGCESGLGAQPAKGVAEVLLQGVESHEAMTQ